MQKACPQCGTTFEVVKKRGPEQIYCQPRCANRASNERKPRALAVHFPTCAFCGDLFTSRRKDRIYCRPLCARRAYCEARKADGRLKAQHQKHAEKRSEWSRENWRRYKGRYQKTLACPTCGESFTCDIDTDRVYCGVLCAAFGRNGKWPTSRLPLATCPDCSRVRLWRAGGSQRCDSCRTAPGHRFRPTRRFRMELYERDGWTCQLCMEPVDSTIDPASDWAASLDHIVPRSRGGSHAPTNLRLAHRWCNAVRGDDSYYTTADLRVA